MGGALFPVMGGGGGTIALSGFTGTVTLSATVPITVANSGGGSVAVIADSSSSVVMTGATGGSLIINAAVASTVGLPASQIGGDVTVIAAAVEELILPDSAANISLICANLDTVSFAGVLGGTVSFVCTGAKLDVGSVDGILIAVEAVGTSDGGLDVSGGTSASPTNDVAATAGSFTVTVGTPMAGDYFTCPKLNASGTTEAFWLSLDGSGSAPGEVGWTKYEVALNTPISDSAAATAIAATVNLMSVNYTAEAVGGVVTLAAISGGVRESVSSVAFGLTVGSEEAGADAYNSKKAALEGRGWTVLTN